MVRRDAGNVLSIVQAHLRLELANKAQEDQDERGLQRCVHGVSRAPGEVFLSIDGDKYIACFFSRFS